MLDGKDYHHAHPLRNWYSINNWYVKTYPERINMSLNRYAKTYPERINGGFQTGRFRFAVNLDLHPGLP